MQDANERRGRSGSPNSVLELPEPPLPSTEERRRQPRARARFLVRMEPGGPLLRGIDLSTGGLMCACTNPVWPGNTLDLEVILPTEAEPVAVRGRVVELVAVDNAIAMRVRFEAGSRRLQSCLVQLGVAAA